MLLSIDNLEAGLGIKGISVVLCRVQTRWDSRTEEIRFRKLQKEWLKKYTVAF
jgi:hypothetical protein